MLTSTFQHIPGVGREKEKRYWKAGIRDWESYAQTAGEQLGLFAGSGNGNDIFYGGKLAVESGNADYFSEVLDHSEWHRIADYFHDDVLFLDIETTGLSLYYDSITIIGWSIGKKYGVYISGQEPDQLKSELEKAKIVITFNGTLFDLKFIRQEFPDISLPKIHIDLRYLCKRVGLSGGQKFIEQEIGFLRPSEIADVSGEQATVLWHEYRRGNNNALRDLIIYNHQDIEGMKHIYDHAVSSYLDINGTPKYIRSKVRFTNKTSTIKWYQRTPKERSPYKVYIEKTKTVLKPSITFDQLNKKRNIENYRVLGIDLVSSEDRGSGVCLLTGSLAQTYTLYTDEELIDIAIENEVDLISIDSPLSIPEGRTSYFDDDPVRDEYGITRLCERILAKRGVKSYPCLIQSMQKLTKRGVELAKKCRKLGIPVIESYPGAAQDIMQIPRKQAGLKYLTSGLAEFGVSGDYINTDVSHDELDAITSAIVGLFYQSEMFEALGNEIEGYMYIPCLDSNSSPFGVEQVVAFSGPIASGKTICSRYLETLGYTRYSFSDALKAELHKSRREINRENLQELGNKFREEDNQSALGQILLKIINNQRSDYISIDGLRFPEDFALLKETYGPKLKVIHIDASNESRLLRYKNENGEITFNEADNNPVESSVAMMKAYSDYHILNDGSIEELEKNLTAILGQQ